MTATLVRADTFYSQCQTPYVVAVYQTFYHSWFNPSAQAYTVYFAECCRRPSFTNITNATPDVYIPVRLVRFTPQDTIEGNSSQFSGHPNPIFYTTETNYLSLSADNMQGDSLYYELMPVRTFVNNTITNATYNTNFSFQNPFGAGVVTTLNSETGVLSVVNPLLGTYALAVKVDAFRNGVLSSRIIKEISVSVQNRPGHAKALQSQTLQSTVTLGSHTSQGNSHLVTVYELGSVYFKFKTKVSSLQSANPASISVQMFGFKTDSLQNNGPCVGLGCATLSAQGG